MIINSKTAEEKAILDAAYAICAAARTAPKACGIDTSETCIVTGTEKDTLSEEMRRLAKENNEPLFARDADNMDKSPAVVLVGVTEKPRGIGKMCSLCHYDGCGDCAENDGWCIFNYIDLGIALGSAVAKAADMRIDNRMMFTIGKAAAALSMLGDNKCIMGIPLSVSGKSVFFDRK